MAGVADWLRRRGAGRPERDAGDAAAGSCGPEDSRRDSGAPEHAPLACCGERIALLPPVERQRLYTRLEFERLGAKYDVLHGLFEETAHDWNETFYRMFLRTLGDHVNQEAYLTLARRIPYRCILRERDRAGAAEAMLLGGSGLLQLYPLDSYTNDLRRDFVHYAAKYGIEPMSAGAWTVAGMRPANHPVARLVQAAAILSRRELIMNALLACRTRQDLEQLFGVDVPSYWTTHRLPNVASDRAPRRMGSVKAVLLGINLVSLLQYAYAGYVDDERLRERAVGLLEELPAEDNRYVRAWEMRGVVACNAFESQALLQLARCYCGAERCGECPLRRLSPATSAKEPR